jgi:ATP-dependent metalloprotease
MSTYQPSRMQQITWIKPQQLPRNIYPRRFGTSSLSRDLLASRESAANRNPTSATAQNSFYQLLLKANMPAIVIERYQSGRFYKTRVDDVESANAIRTVCDQRGCRRGLSESAGHD